MEVSRQFLGEAFAEDGEYKGEPADPAELVGSEDEEEPAKEEASDEDLEKASEEAKTEDDLQEAADQAGSEGMTTRWVQAHLPRPEFTAEDLLKGAVPRCGLNGAFDYLQVDEALDPSIQLCRHCCSRTESRPVVCTKICTHAP